MAARDRFGPYMPDPNASQLQRFIARACDPSNYEPNLALNLEIADLINQKKGNAPREAAVAIVNHINNRNPNVSLLALALLDICVKNCGYPFHLQISTKDFLNELVRRFPERPPPRPSRVQLKILEAIEEWRGTICETSRYKDDLGFIRDMHRLLSYKGYRFPTVKKEDAAVLNPSDHLKSAEEMEEEERAAQSAKLQELIRRGTPADLQEANQLMKIMTGYDTRNKTDYRAEAAKDVARLRKKAQLLDEMLDKVSPGEKIGHNDAFVELVSALKTAQPKIQKMVEEESDDHEAVVKLLEVNDNINTVIEKYNLVKKGDLKGAAKLPSTAASSSAAPPKKEKTQEVSLIDLLDDSSGPSTDAGSNKPAGDDLLGLAFDNPSGGSGSTADLFGSSGGGIALGFGANSAIPGPPLLSSTMHTSTAGQQFSISPSPSPVPGKGKSPAPPPGYDPFGALGVGYTSPATQTQPPPPAPSQPATTTTTDATDDWADFASALPPAPAETLVLAGPPIKIVVEAARAPGNPAGAITLRARFSNVSAQPIRDLTFQMAAPKAYTLQMQPQSGRVLPAGARDGVTQEITVAGVPAGEGGRLKVRWKVAYAVLGQGGSREEQGMVEGMNVV